MITSCRLRVPFSAIRPPQRGHLSAHVGHRVDRHDGPLLAMYRWKLYPPGHRLPDKAAEDPE